MDLVAAQPGLNGPTPNSPLATNTTSKAAEDPDAVDVNIVLTIVYLLIFVIGVVGNICNCLVIADSRNKYMKTATNYYLFSLSVSDLLLLIFGLPHDVVILWRPSPYMFSQFVCISRGWISEASTYASVLVIVAFTVERYLAICHPLKMHTFSSLSRPMKIIFIIWLVASSCALLVVMQFGLIMAPELGPDGKEVLVAQCTVVGQSTSIFELSVLIFFIIPMAVLTILYVKLGYHLRQKACLVKKNKLTRDQRLLTATSATATAITTTIFRSEEEIHRKRRAASANPMITPQSQRLKLPGQKVSSSSQLIHIEGAAQPLGAANSVCTEIVISGDCEGAISAAPSDSARWSMPSLTLSRAAELHPAMTAPRTMANGTGVRPATAAADRLSEQQRASIAQIRQPDKAKGDNFAGYESKGLEPLGSWRSSAGSSESILSGREEGEEEEGVEAGGGGSLGMGAGSRLTGTGHLARNNQNMALNYNNNNNKTLAEDSRSAHCFINGTGLSLVADPVSGSSFGRHDSSTSTSSKNQKQFALHSTVNAANMQSVIKMLVSVVVMFFICWAPFHAQRLMAIYVTEPTPEQKFIFAILNHISGISYYISAVANPILYSLFSVRFRQAFRDTFGGALRLFAAKSGAVR